MTPRHDRGGRTRGAGLPGAGHVGRRRERPARPEPAASKSPEQQGGAATDRSRLILIVEDEPNVRLVFRTALTSDEYTVAVAEDGETALSYLAREPFDLVLLDLRMPGLDGLEVLRRLRAAGNDVPVVIVSAHDSTPNVVQTIRLGALDFLPKPTTPEQLRRVVSEVLARHADRPAPPPAAPASPAAGALADAKRALGRRDFNEAENALGKALDRDPRCAEARYLMGVLHELRGQTQCAYGAYWAALQADPDYEPAKLHLMKYFNDRLM